MSYQFFVRKSALTTLKCPKCGACLTAERSCFSARMHCEMCNEIYPIEDYIAKADEKLEDFLDGLYIDRI